MWVARLINEPLQFFSQHWAEKPEKKNKNIFTLMCTLFQVFCLLSAVKPLKYILKDFIYKICPVYQMVDVCEEGGMKYNVMT